MSVETKAIKKKIATKTAATKTNLVVILTMPLQFSREYTIGELTKIFEDGAKAIVKTVPGVKLNRAPDVGLEMDKFPEWKKGCCGPHALPNLSCDCHCHDEEERE